MLQKMAQISISVFLCTLLFTATLFTVSIRSLLSFSSQTRDYANRHYYAIEVIDDSVYTPNAIGQLLSITYEGPIGQLSNHHLFSTVKVTTHFRKRDLPGGNREGVDPVIKRYQSLKAKRDNERRNLLGKRVFQTIDGIISVEKQKVKRLHKRVPLPAPPEIPEFDPSVSQPQIGDDQLVMSLGIHDPGFKYQWHLYNTVQLGNDINITGVWQEGITGKGVVVALIDDGLDMSSEDLAPNYFPDGSYDFNDHNPTPRPRLIDDQHGTRCAGEIAAVRNDACGIGIAWDSKVAGIRILSGEINEADEAAALNYGYQQNHIYSCSWGPPDDGRSIEAPQGLILKAMINGIEKGRGGKGSLYVFASGNGAANGDNCNFDGYTNSIYTITVGAVDRNNNHPFYSEQCSALLVTTYSSGGGNYIYTTDVGTRACSSNHGGTSAAAPIAAGIFALVLEIRPDLTWRDVQYLALLSAMPFNLDDNDWTLTAAGRYYSNKFGYGKMDAYRIVHHARTYKNLGPQVTVETSIINVNESIPMDDDGILSTIEITQADVDYANFGRLEHVTVTVNIDHTRRGDIEVDLISPSMVRSKLAPPRKLDSHEGGLSNWTFSTVKHWDEPILGDWTIQVRDQKDPKHSGVFKGYIIKFWGEQRELSTTPSPTQNKTNSPPETTIIGYVPPKEPVSATYSSIPTSPLVAGNAPLAVAREKWIYFGFGMGAALLLAGLVYYGKRWWNKHSSGRSYEFAVLSEDDNYVDGDPLTSGRQVMTSKEIFDTFGDNDDDGQVLYDTFYTND